MLHAAFAPAQPMTPPFLAPHTAPGSLQHRRARPAAARTLTTVLVDRRFSASSQSACFWLALTTRLLPAATRLSSSARAAAAASCVRVGLVWAITGGGGGG